MIKCEKCGTPVSENSLKCSKCGAEYEKHTKKEFSYLHSKGLIASILLIMAIGVFFEFVSNVAFNKISGGAIVVILFQLLEIGLLIAGFIVALVKSNTIPLAFLTGCLSAEFLITLLSTNDAAGIVIGIIMLALNVLTCVFVSLHGKGSLTGKVFLAILSIGATALLPYTLIATVVASTVAGGPMAMFVLTELFLIAGFIMLIVATFKCFKNVEKTEFILVK